MSRLLKASEINGLPVVTVTGGEDVAEVKDVIYGADEGRLIGFTLNKRGFLKGKLKRVLAASSVTAIGRHAVMIPDGSCLVDKGDAPVEVAKPQVDRNVLGNHILTEGGKRLGAVTDLVVMMGTNGEVVGYELARDDSHDTWFIPRPAQLAVSGDTLLVPNDLEGFVFDDLSGFGGAIDRYRQEHGG